MATRVLKKVDGEVVERWIDPKFIPHHVQDGWVFSESDLEEKPKKRGRPKKLEEATDEAEE